jgi:hypothetical protein
MGLVAVKAVGGGLVPVAGLGIHRGDHPVGRGALEDPEAAVAGLLDVLAGDGGQQHRRLSHSWVQPLASQGKVGPVGVADQRIHQRLTGGPVGPVTSRLARGGIAILALQARSHPGLELRWAGPQQPPDRPPQHRDGVLGGDRILQRGRVQHPLDPHQPHLTCEVAGHPEDPIRVLRAAQPGGQVDQDRVGEAGRLLPSHRIGRPGRVPPAHVEGEAVGRLPITQAFQALQDHDHGQNRRRHRAAPGRLEQVGEQLGREQPTPLPGQEPIHRALRQGCLAPAGTSGRQLRAAQLAAQGHSRSSRSATGRRESASSADQQRIRHRTPAT